MNPKRDITAETEARQACQRLWGDQAHVHYQRGPGFFSASARSPLQYGSREQVTVTGDSPAVAASRLRTCLLALEAQSQPADAPAPLDAEHPTVDAVAEALVVFTERIAAIAKPLTDDDVLALVARCRREAHPQPGDNHNFPVPVWEWPAEVLERELRFRRVVDRLVTQDSITDPEST